MESDYVRIQFPMCGSDGAHPVKTGITLNVNMKKTRGENGVRPQTGLKHFFIEECRRSTSSRSVARWSNGAIRELNFQRALMLFFIKEERSNALRQHAICAITSC